MCPLKIKVIAIDFYRLITDKILSVNPTVIKLYNICNY